MHGSWANRAAKRTQEDMPIQRLHVHALCPGEQQETDYGKASEAETITREEPRAKERSKAACFHKKLQK